MHFAKAPDLTRHPPRSPRERVGGYAILGRTIDKARAKLFGNIGEYQYDSPLDNLTFNFAGVTGSDFLVEVEKKKNDHELAEWISTHGTTRTESEVEKWSDKMEEVSLYRHPDFGDFFQGACEHLGLDPERVTLFDMLEADDRATFDLANR